MANLIYVTNVSLDGYIEDERGAFDWLPMDDEVFALYTDLLRSVGTFLYGRRLYEAMAVWETDAALAAQSDLTADFASAWQAANKVVYSTTLAAVSTADTRLERRFDPAAVHELKATAGSDLTVGGANLAAQAFKTSTTSPPDPSTGSTPRTTSTHSSPASPPTSQHSRRRPRDPRRINAQHHLARPD
jgi:dihydrofolate reductase